MSARITLKELSKLLNLSVSTISKALNDSSEISDKTKKRVQDLASLNNYIPNISARNLKLERTKTVGVIIPSLKSSFFTEILQGIEAKADSMNYKILLSFSNESIVKEKQSISKFIHNQVDGIIVSPSRETQIGGDIQHLTALQDYGTPLIIFDRFLDGVNCDRISINETKNAELAVKKMHDSGCSNIAFLSRSNSTLIHQQRKFGYNIAMQSIKSTPIVLEYQNEFPMEQMKNLIDNNKLDGILACSEYRAIETMKNILNLGYSIPKDVSVIGFDNGQMSKNFFPSLSAIDQKARQQGELALTTLASRIEGKLPVEKMNYQLKAEIILRQSTRSLNQVVA